MIRFMSYFERPMKFSCYCMIGGGCYTQVMKLAGALFFTAFLVTGCGQSEDATSAKSFNSSWTPQYNNIVEYWSMSNSLWTDASVFYATIGDNGSVNNASGTALKSTSGPVSFATHFTGNNGWISVPYKNNLNLSIFSLSLWVRMSGGGGDRSLLSSRSTATGAKGYTLSINNSDQVEVRLGQGSPNSWGATTGLPLLSNAWTHIVFTYDGSTIRLYQNGTLQGSSVSAYTQNISQPFYLGAGGTENSPAASDFFTGDIDEVAIWSGVLSASEVQTIYSRQTL